MWFDLFSSKTYAQYKKTDGDYDQLEMTDRAGPQPYQDNSINSKDEKPPKKIRFKWQKRAIKRREKRE